MESINSYKNSIGMTYAQNTSNTVNSIENNNNQNKDNKISTNKDSIVISQKDQNVINTKKSYDAFLETSKQYETGDEQFPPAFYYNMIQSVMEDRGMSVPDFKLDGENPQNTNFVGFVDKLKDFTKSLMKDNEINGIPNNFFDFCNTYKENLIRYGCN